ncbi:glutamate receptor 2.9-like [Cornus florida]|uniref:glutamate receptor 2.9-like n=1 Tax=Cornus florida TaxID=4283 RepID=UPI0028A10D37|nr:glutamate receptor 2.9-like [Cornus florida]
MTLTQAMMKSDGKMSSSNMLGDSILSSNFTGLSGEMRFQEGRVLSSSQKFSIVNIANQEYKKLGFWSSESRFSDSLAGTKKIDNLEELGGFAEVIWPGNPERIPGRWAPMKIAVPGRVSFKKFLNAGPDEKSGFIISLYKETFDATVGDIMIIAKRWSLVEFSVPFMESALHHGNVGGYGIIFIYTILIVWFLEQRSNPEFSGPWKEQLGNVLWFTFSTLFFVHREKIQNYYTRSVIVVWLFVVLILTHSYTASLTSMLTFSRLRPTMTDIERLQRTNVRVGCAACNGGTFVRKYLEDVYKFKPENIIHIRNQSEYLRAFENGNISAAFLEVPYAKVFVNQYCNRYEYGSFTSRFGGFGFVSLPFQIGSRLAALVSEAILDISENGRLNELEKELFDPSSECSKFRATKNSDSLSIQGFLGLYIISAATSTICLLLYLIMKRRIPRYLSNAETRIPQRASSSGDHIELNIQ